MLKNSNKTEIYEKWITSTPIILPRKLQVKSISDEPERQRRLREKMALDKFHTEIELLKLRAESNEEKYKSVDEQMAIEISKKADGTLYENVIKLWEEECENEEIISLQRWQKSDTWFNNYETGFRKEYNTDNPFLKKVKTKTYAEAIKESTINGGVRSRNVNKNFDGNVQNDNKKLNWRNRSPSLPRRTQFNTTENYASQRNRNFYNAQQNQRLKFQNQYERPYSKFGNERRNNNFVRQGNSYVDRNATNQNTGYRFLEPGERNRDTRWNRFGTRNPR